MAQFEKSARLVVLVWFYVFAVTLPQPLCTMGGNAQNAIGGPDVVRIKTVSYRHELVNRDNWPIGEKFRMGLNIFSDSRLTEYEQAAIRRNRAFGGKWRWFTFDNAKPDKFRLNFDTARPNNIQLKNERLVSDEMVVKSGRITFEMRQYSCQTRNERIDVCLNHIIETAAFSDSSTYKLIRIESPHSISTESSMCPEKVPGLSNLAHGEISSARKLLCNAVGSEVGQVRCFDNHNLSASRSLRKTQTNKYQANEWKYMRFEMGGSSGYTFDKATNSLVLLLSNQDIDVSNDGKQWFHIAGPHCFANARQLRSIPQSTKHDRPTQLP
jgi:hypothetical protein